MAWCDWFEMDLSKFDPNNFIDILSEDEKQRAKRFKIEKVAKSFVKCRGFLRTVISRYLFIKPNIIKNNSFKIILTVNCLFFLC